MTKSAISTGITLTVVALIVIVGTGIYLSSNLNASITSTTSTHVATTITTKKTTSNSSLYQLKFNQTGICRPGTSLYGAYFIPWSVTLTSGSYNATKTQPPNSNLSNGFTSTRNASYSFISFLVPNGTYNYTLNPVNNFENSQGFTSGTATINGDNVTVYVSFNLASCGSTVSTTTTSKTTTYTTSAVKQSLIMLDLSNGSAACQNIIEGQQFLANWSGNACILTGSDQVSNFAVKPDITLEILSGVTLVLKGGGFANYGTIINNGTMKVYTPLGSYGVIVNSGLMTTNSTIYTEFDTHFMSNGGTFENYGSFLINGHVGYYQHNETYSNGTIYFHEGNENLTGGSFTNGGILQNYGTINNTGWFWNVEAGFDFNSTIDNFGTIQNLEYAQFINNYTISNNGIMINSGYFTNDGKILAYCNSNFVEASAGSFYGNSVVGACGTTTTERNST